jgi:two-component system, sensor histidine kinase
MEAVDPKQLAKEGQAEYSKGEYLSAAKLYKAAADGYLSSGDEILAAEMANNSSVAFLQGGDSQAALDVVWGSDEVFAKHGESLRQAMALGNQAAALEALKRLDEALETYDKSAELLNTLGEFELRAYVQQSVSAIKMRKGQYLEAYAYMRDGVSKIDKPNFRQRLLKSLIDLPFKFLR